VQYRPFAQFYGCFAHLRESYFARIICKASVKLYEKSTIFHRAQGLTLARNRSEPVVFY